MANAYFALKFCCAIAVLLIFVVWLVFELLGWIRGRR